MSDRLVDAKVEWVVRVLDVARWLDLALPKPKISLKERDWNATESRLDALDLDPLTEKRLPPKPEKKPEPRKLTITLKNPPGIEFAEPGITLTAEHFIAAEDVSGLKLDYEPKLTTVLEAGDHTLSVSLAQDDPANANVVLEACVPATLVVSRRKLTITLRNPNAVTFDEPGVTLAAEHFIAAEDLSTRKLGYNPELGTELQAGEHPLGLTLTADQANRNYVLETCIAARFVVRRKPITLTVLANKGEFVFEEPGFTLEQEHFLIKEKADHLALGFKPKLGTKLEAGDDHPLEVVLADDKANGNYTLTSCVPGSLAVQRKKLTITLRNPPAEDFADPGIVLTAQHFIAAEDISGRKLDYDPPLHTVLRSGDHPLTVSLPAEQANRNYVLEECKSARFTINRAKGLVTLAPAGPVVYAPGGYKVQKSVFGVTNPQALDLLYVPDPTAGGVLSAAPAPQAIHVSLADTDRNSDYDMLPVSAMLQVDPLPCTLVWTMPKPFKATAGRAKAETTGGAFTLTDEFLCAVVTDGKKAIAGAPKPLYDHPMNEKLSPGEVTITASAPDANYVAPPVAIVLKVTLSETDKTLSKTKTRKGNQQTGPKPYDPDNPNTWVAIGTIRYENAAQGFCDGLSSPADKKFLQSIAACQGSDEHAPIAAGKRFHCHVMDGSGGLSFCYDHKGGNSVEAVVYDTASGRGSLSNSYKWDNMTDKKGKGIKGASTAYTPVRQK